MDKLVIESGISPPDIVRIGWPHKTMRVGQSFFVEGRSMVAVCNANNRYKRKLGWKFTARKQDGGIRVWRIA
jgi:hypothetical protein